MVDATPFKPKRSTKSKFPAGFNVGAVCKLRSGGMLVSITDQLTGEPPAVHCCWLAGDGFLQEHSFPVSCLRLATESELAGTVDSEDETAE